MSTYGTGSYGAVGGTYGSLAITGPGLVEVRAGVTGTAGG